MSEEFSVEALDHEDARALTEVLSLLERAFGPGPMTREKLRALAVDSSAICLIIRLPPGGHTIGAFGVAGALSEERRASYAGFGPEADAFVADRSRAFGSLRILAVDPAARRRGLGRALGTRMYEGLRALGCTHALGVCWDHGGPDTSRRLFERGGFHEAGASRDFYRERQRLNEHHCRYCGVPCSCLARLYARAL